MGSLEVGGNMEKNCKTPQEVCKEKLEDLQCSMGNGDSLKEAENITREFLKKQIGAGLPIGPQHGEDWKDALLENGVPFLEYLDVEKKQPGDIIVYPKTSSERRIYDPSEK